MGANSSPRLPTDPAFSSHDAKSEELEALRQRFDVRLALLNDPDANKKLRVLIDRPLDLSGVKVGHLPPTLK